jgi:uncharacterized protein YgiM (DUF1202 family)
VLATALLLAVVPVAAAEKGQVIRAGDLLAQPFIDATSAAKLTAGQAVSIVERRGPWVSVQAGGKTGWVRLLNLRLEPAVAVAGLARPPSGPKPSGLSSLSSLTTGSSGRTVTTGVKGMDEEDIRASTPNYAELTLLEGLGVEATDARTAAAKSKLVERSVDYLDKKRGK